MGLDDVPQFLAGHEMLIEGNHEKSVPVKIAMLYLPTTKSDKLTHYRAMDLITVSSRSSQQPPLSCRIYAEWRSVR